MISKNEKEKDILKNENIVTKLYMINDIKK